jgi:hypothetical protein
MNMSKKAPSYANQILGLSEDGVPTSVLDMMSVGKPAPKRKRAWESQRPVASYRIPAPLIHLAKDAQKKILSRAESDEQGRPRAGLSADTVADVIVRWAIKRVNENPNTLPQITSPHAKSGLTAFAEEWDDWNGKSPAYPEPRRKNKKKQTPRLVIAYRLQDKTKSEIKRLATDNGWSVGEMFLYLIQIGLAGHDGGKFRIKTRLQAVSASADFEEVKN